MAKTQAGIRAVGLCAIGSISSPTYFLPLGLRQKGNIVISEFNQPENYRGQKLRNMMNIKADLSTLQGSGSNSDLVLIYTLSNFMLQGGVDAQIVLMEGTKASERYTGDVLNFTGDDSFGVDVDFTLTPKGRDNKIMLETAIAYSKLEAIILAGKTNQQVANFNLDSGLGNAGINYPYYAAPYLIDIEAPSATSLFSIRDLKDFRLNIKSVSEKSEIDNRSRVQWIEVTYEVTAWDAGIMNDKLQGLLAKSNNVQLALDFGLNSIDTQRFVFNAGVLSMNNEITFGDDSRLSKVTFNGRIPLTDFVAAMSTHATGTVTVTL